MRILLICGSLEPHLDGVGDYTRTLGRMLANRGHKVSIVAIHDKYVSSHATIIPDANLPNLLQLRISSKCSLFRRWFSILRHLRSFRPSFVSFQYVPYAYAHNGIPLAIVPLAMLISAWGRFHVTFHELWIEAPNSISLNYFINLVIRYLQILIAKSLAILASIHNCVCFTSTSSYQSRLLRVGITSQVIPIFSSIPLYNNLVKPRKSFATQSLNIDPSPNQLVVVFFGSMRPAWSDNNLRAKLLSLLPRLGKDSVLYISIGFMSRACNERWLEFSSKPCKNLETFVSTGVLSDTDVSQYLQDADFGVAFNSFSQLCKSSSVAAMRCHGLPIIITSNLDSDPVPLSEEWWAIPLNSRFNQLILSSKKYAPIDSLQQLTSSILELAQDRF